VGFDLSRSFGSFLGGPRQKDDSLHTCAHRNEVMKSGLLRSECVWGWRWDWVSGPGPAGTEVRVWVAA
jgi:hypothetical protein